MNSYSQIEIPLSKTKIGLLLLASIAFVVLGVLFVMHPEKWSSSHYNPVIVFTGGLASILFFGLCGVSMAKKMFDRTPGLVVSDEGIVDNSGGASAGLIYWSDIETIKEIKVASQILLNIIVRNPQHYIDRQTSAFKRKVMQMNLKSSGTPISISANGLQCNYASLKDLLETKLEEYKSIDRN
jgi:hypothetical protein